MTLCMYVDSLLDLARAFSGDLRDLLPVKLNGQCKPAEIFNKDMSPGKRGEGVSKNKLWIRGDNGGQERNDIGKIAQIGGSDVSATSGALEGIFEIRS